MTFKLHLPKKTDTFIPLQTINRKGVIHDISIKDSGLFIDPGIKNFAICHIEYHQVQSSKLLEFPLHEVKMETYRDCINNFIKEILQLISIAKPKIIACERFMPRGFSRLSLELIGEMIGIITEICRREGIIFYQITSAQWKVKIKKIIDLKTLYKTAKKNHKLAPHNVDAMCIGKFVLNKHKIDAYDVDWIHENLPYLTVPLK